MSNSGNFFLLQSITFLKHVCDLLAKGKISPKHSSGFVRIILHLFWSGPIFICKYVRLHKQHENEFTIPEGWEGSAPPLLFVSSSSGSATTSWPSGTSSITSSSFSLISIMSTTTSSFCSCRSVTASGERDEEGRFCRLLFSAFALLRHPKHWLYLLTATKSIFRFFKSHAVYLSLV